MTTKLSKFVGRYDFSTESNESTIKMLENEQGKVRTGTDRRDLVRSDTIRYDQTTNPLRYAIKCNVCYYEHAINRS
ncbi:hypothetical protein DPMN_194271 [Dreissena polymorpha]|uniref:Uncharacterized protein n=1 Tax=Dreissena polymorpha TaxID=45954 RepID=A0A9D3Y3E1_DREPO|nr:hypothetical protein DPMN_194271 [Dreissena polymorpha]